MEVQTIEVGIVKIVHLIFALGPLLVKKNVAGHMRPAKAPMRVSSRQFFLVASKKRKKK